MLQASFLDNMVITCADDDSTESTWAADQEVATTEELEARLRSHRLGQSQAVLSVHVTCILYNVSCQVVDAQLTMDSASRLKRLSVDQA